MKHALQNLYVYIMIWTARKAGYQVVTYREEDGYITSISFSADETQAMLAAYDTARTGVYENAQQPHE